MKAVTLHNSDFVNRM
jgi:hypothetical protein